MNTEERVRVNTIEELASLPRGAVVCSTKGTIACHVGGQRGVVFGDERPFGWQNLALPAVVLWHPERDVPPAQTPAGSGA